MSTKFLLLAVVCASCVAQEVVIPLESVDIEGSTIPAAVVLEMAGLKLDAPIDKAGIEQACQKLRETGLFASISYRYAPGPKQGYAVTLSLADQAPLAEASIDIPGVDAAETWRWLVARFHRFDRVAPQADTAQQYLAHEIERHVGSAARGQHLTVRVETDFKTRKLLLSFQPETLPRVVNFSFTGNSVLASDTLGAVLKKIVADTDYTERKFLAAVEMNLRPLYEERGYYRARLSPGAPQWVAGGVSVNVAVAEGAPYQLGKVEVVGDGLPVEGMMSAGRLPVGRLANWRQIQEGMWEMDKVVRRAGYFQARSSDERSYDDTAHVLNLRVVVNKGPLYRWGEIRFTGLGGEVEAAARKVWKPRSGDPYDYGYPNEFLRDFSKVVNFGLFRKYEAVTTKGRGDFVMDMDVTFVARQ
ncbi:MAG: hypothetical protein ABI806_11205 [Candidatus Solibacter sp.]